MSASAFDALPQRRGTGSLKWDEMIGAFGMEDATGHIPMWVADMDFPAPEPVVQALVRRAAHGVYGYAGGLNPAREAVAGWLERRHGYVIDPEWVLFAPGTVPGLCAALTAVTQPGDGVVVQSPVYFPFFESVKSNGRRLELSRLRLDETPPSSEKGPTYGMDFADLAQRLARSKAMLLCSPHNPGGRVWTREELEKLTSLCLEHDAFMISDEVHFDLVLHGAHTVLPSLSPEVAARTVLISSPGKTFNLAGLGLAWCVAPDAEVRAKVLGRLRAAGLHEPNVMAACALQAAYAQGEPWLDDLLDYLRCNMAMVDERVARLRPAGVRAVPIQATYLAWLDFREFMDRCGLDENGLSRLFLDTARVAPSFGRMFGPGGEGFVRLNTACPRAMLEEALERIAQAVARAGSRP